MTVTSFYVHLMMFAGILGLCGNTYQNNVGITVFRFLHFSLLIIHVQYLHKTAARGISVYDAIEPCVYCIQGGPKK